MDNYYCPEELERVRKFVETYNNERYHESLENSNNPADAFWPRRPHFKERQRIKHNVLEIENRVRKLFPK
ncbi:MAG: hypothetical protein IPL25_08805 [Saprospiraceae bacterium]|nr:hypothetical protein [Candidatus Vicinibacter affinis]